MKILPDYKKNRMKSILLNQKNDRDDPVYYGIRDLINLIDEMDKDHYKPVRVKGAFNDNYMEYESRG